MRFHDTSTARAKRVAKDLRLALSERGIKTSLPECQDTVAAMYGFAHWRQMQAEIGLNDPSPPDHEADQETIDARRKQHADVLRERYPALGRGAWFVSDAVGPTRAVSSGDWMDLPNEHVGISVMLLDRMDMSGFALVEHDGDEMVSFVMGKQGSLFTYDHFVDLSGPVPTKEAAWNILDSVRHEPDSSPFVLGKVGYGLNRLASDSTCARLARQSLERHLDPRLVQVLAAGQAREIVAPSKIEGFYMETARGENRREFAAIYPAYAGLATYAGDKLGDEAGMGPDGLLVRVLEVVGNLPHDQAVVAFSRMVGNEYSHGSIHMPTILGALALLPDHMVPVEAQEVEDFMVVVRSIGSSLCRDLPRDFRISRLLSIVCSSGGKSWKDMRASLQLLVLPRVWKRWARSSNEDMVHAPWALVSGILVPDLVRRGLLSDEALFISGRPGRNWAMETYPGLGVLYRKAYAMVMDGLTFDDYLRVAASWSQVKESVTPKPPFAVLDDELEARLVAWNSCFGTTLTFDDLLAVMADAMESEGMSITDMDITLRKKVVH